MSPAPAERTTSAAEGECAYRYLSYYFELWWSSEVLGGFATRLFAPFETRPDPHEAAPHAPPGVPPVYGLVQTDAQDERPFRLHLGADLLTASPMPGPVLAHLFTHIEAEAVRNSGDLFLLGGGAAVGPAGGVVIAGPPDTGKSRLLAGLVEAGWDHLSDGFAVIDPVQRLLLPHPRPLTFGAEEFDLVAHLRPEGDDAGVVTDTWLVPPERVRLGCLGSPSPVRLVVVVDDHADTARLSELSRAQAVAALGGSAPSLRRYRRRGLRLLLDVVTSARRLRLSFRDTAAAVGLLADAAAPIDHGPIH